MLSIIKRITGYNRKSVELNELATLIRKAIEEKK
jgi:hypothetical protein